MAIETIDHKIPVRVQINFFLFLSLKVKECDIIVLLKVMLFFCYKNENIRYTVSHLNPPSLNNTQSQIDQMPGRQTYSRNFRQKVLSTFLRIPNVLLRNDKRFQKFICFFFVDKCSELVHIIISLGCRQLGNSTLLIRLPGTVSNGLNARQLEIFTKMPLKGSFKLLKSIRCQLRKVQRFQKLIFFFSGQILRAFAYYNSTTISLGYRHFEILRF